MNTQKTTGYPSIDKPWMKYYGANINYDMEYCDVKLVDFMRNSAKKHLKETAINYFGNKVSYENLLINITQVASAFAALGVKNNDSVALMLPNLPETIYAEYALNDLGACFVPIDPRTGPERIKQYITERNCKVLVTIDLAIPKVDKIIHDISVEKVIYVSGTESLPYILRIGAEIKKVLGNIRNGKSYYISWLKMIKNGTKYGYISAKYEKGKDAAVFFTSGSSGFSKGVIHTDYSLNAEAYQYLLSGIPHGVEDRFLNIIPSFLLYGFACGIHMPLCLGMTDIVIPQVNFEHIGDLIFKYKPQHFALNPELFRNLISSDKMKNENLSYCVTLGIGGSGISVKDEVAANEFLKKHNCKHVLGKGYGATEGGSALATVINNKCDKLGSAGIPLPLNNISIFEFLIDEDEEIVHTDHELKYGECGEICCNGPTLMKAYLNNDVLTSKTLIRHRDGKLWLHLGDSGYMDSDGNIYVNMRIGRMIITPDSHNIYLGSIENVIKNHYAVKECAVVGINVPEYDIGKLPKACIVLKDQYKGNAGKIVEELNEKCFNELPERDVARYYQILESLPMTSTLKIDYKKLENESVGELYQPDTRISELVSGKIFQR